MRVLALETATRWCSAAVVSGGRAIAERSLSTPRVHSEKLLTLTDGVLSDARLSLTDIDAVCISIGPGSFTGLRIGLSAAKGIAFAASKPLVAVPTLEAIAWNTALFAGVRGGLVLPMIDARREDVYCALYYYDGSALDERAGARAIHLDEIRSLIEGGGPVTVAGDAAAKFSRYLSSCPDAYRGRFRLPEVPNEGSGAAAVGILGSRRFAELGPSDLASLEPLYVKDFHTLLRTQHPLVH